jgi:nucleotide-binding universal stress UspA family protein
VTTIEENDSPSGNESVADVARYLNEHGVKARSQTIGVGHADAALALSEIAREIGADMIVSGGYGHSRLRELIFGGVTRSLLRESFLNRLISN